MITCKRSFLEARCRERCYTLDEVMPCVVSQNDDEWTIDAEHEAYPLKPKEGCAPLVGPGAELKKLLAGWPLRIVVTEDCPCNSHAAEMDRREAGSPGWCEQNIDTIVGWLREQASERGLPFLDAVGRMLVRRAIKNSLRRRS